MRTMYDSTNVSDIPHHGAQLVAGYIDGNYENYGKLTTVFPGVPAVPISVTGGGLDKIGPGHGVALDIENGALTVHSGCLHFADLYNRGRVPVIYCSLALWPDVDHELDRYKIPAKHRYRWIAHYTGKAHLEAGSIATQYAAPGNGSPGHYDISAVAPYWPGIDPKPVTPLRASTRRAARRLERHLAGRNNPTTKADMSTLDAARVQIERVTHL